MLSFELFLCLSGIIVSFIAFLRNEKTKKTDREIIYMQGDCILDLKKLAMDQSSLIKKLRDTKCLKCQKNIELKKP